MQSSFVLCLGSTAFLIVDLTSHGQWHTSPVGRQKPYSCTFAHGGNHLSLAIRKGSTLEVVLARYQNCSSKLCLSFGANESISLQQRQLARNYVYNCGTARYQMPWSKLVLSGDCVVQTSEVAKL